MNKRHAQLKVMLTLQNNMNQKVHPQWQQQAYEWYRAIWIECGELMDHQGYKWWKKQVPEADQVQLEIVDIWHFGLSAMFDGRSIDDLADAVYQEIDSCAVVDQSVLLATEKLALFALSDKRLCVPSFLSLLAAADMTLDDLYTRYVGKNVLNFFRQDNGYKDGSYIKQWQGREDNEHLVELANQLDSSSEAFPDLLYNALDARYKSCNA